MQGNETFRGFLQGSGIRYGRDNNRKTNKIINVQIYDHAEGAWEPLQDNATYFMYGFGGTDAHQRLWSQGCQ